MQTMQLSTSPALPHHCRCMPSTLLPCCCRVCGGTSAAAAGSVDDPPAWRYTGWQTTIWPYGPACNPRPNSTRLSTLPCLRRCVGRRGSTPVQKKHRRTCPKVPSASVANHVTVEHPYLLPSGARLACRGVRGGSVVQVQRGRSLDDLLRRIPPAASGVRSQRQSGWHSSSPPIRFDGHGTAPPKAPFLSRRRSP